MTTKNLKALLLSTKKITPTKLTPQQQLCRYWITTFQDDNEGKTPTLDALAIVMKCSRERVRQHVDRLVELGVIKKTRTSKHQTLEVLK